MSLVYSADVVFERKLRGHLPVTRSAVTNDGEVTIAVPDEHQSRLYHLSRVSPDGECSRAESFSVETLSGFDLCMDGSLAVGVTADDVYLFHDGAKTRFLPEGRNNYIAASMTASGEFFSLALSDMLMSSYSIVLARPDGIVWTKDLPLSISDAQISPDGQWILVGADEGSLSLMDRSRTTVWRIDGDDPISDVAMSGSIALSVAGTKGGAVQAIGPQGERMWEIVGDGPVASCACSADGSLIVAARDLPDWMGYIEMYGADGSPLVDYRDLCRVTGIACSPNGRFVAVSCSDGTFLVLEVSRASSGGNGGESRSLCQQAAAAIASGDHEGAIGRLVEALSCQPGNADACRRLIEARSLRTDALIAEAERAAAACDMAACSAALRSALAVNPFDRSTFDRVTSVRDRLVAEARADSNRCSAEGDGESALRRLRGLALLDDTGVEIRESIAALESALADEYARRADAAEVEGDARARCEMLEKALALRHSDSLAEALAKSRSAEAFQEGLALYEQKRYAQSLSQFRRAVSLDPSNSEAARYVEYAESVRQDDSLYDRFNRLE